MTEASSLNELWALCALLCISAAWGLSGSIAAILPSPRAKGLLHAAHIPFLCAVCAAAFHLALLRHMDPAILLISAACALFAAMRLPGFFHACRHASVIFANRHVQWASVLVVSVGLVFAWTGQSESDFFQPDEAEFNQLRGPAPTDLELDSSACRNTDAGRSVALWLYACEGATPEKLHSAEETFLRNASLANRILHSHEPDPGFNCHGWVFTGGTHWIRGEDVDAILEDNGYAPVTDPRPEDLAIYRNEQGQVTHTGLVCAGGNGRMLLVESKWGWLGRYVHAPSIQPYGGTITYYRSPRQGHLLAG